MDLFFVHLDLGGGMVEVEDVAAASFELLNIAN